MTERPMPEAVEAERCVLGSMLIPGTPAYERVAPIVSESDFRSEPHRLIFRTIAAMEGKGVDLLTVKAALSAQGELDGAGGSAYVSGLIDQIPDVANVERYARMVRDAANKRRAIVECQRLQAAAFSGEPISDIAAMGAALFSSMVQARDGGQAAIRDVSRRTLERLERRVASGEWITGIRTSLPAIDAYTLGFQRCVLSVIGARVRVGKTALTILAALAAAASGLRTLIFQLDMSETMFGNRALAAVSGVSSFKIRSGQGLAPDEWKRIAEADSLLRSYEDRLIVDHVTRDIAAIGAIVRRESRDRGLDLLIVDHIGHVRGGRGEKRYLELGDVSSRLIELAGETNAAALALVQLGRAAEDREPSLSDLRESGNLEQDARLVMLLDRPFLRGEPRPQCSMDVHVVKNEGEAGAKFQVHFDLTRQRITEDAQGRCHHCGDAAMVQRIAPWEASA